MLVLQGMRVLQLRWDRAGAEAGDTCELLVAGARLAAPVDVQVERDDGSGVWTAVETLRLTVSADGTQASTQWTAGHAASDDVGSLTGWFEDADLQIGDTAWISARSSDPDGASLEFFLEREAGADWVLAGQAVSMVRNGLARAGMRLEAAAADPAKDLGSLRITCTFPLVSIYLVRKDEGPVELGGPTGITTDAVAISSKLFVFNEQGSASFERLPPGDYFAVIGSDNPNAIRSPSQAFRAGDEVQVKLEELLGGGIFFGVPVSAGGRLEVRVKASYQTVLSSCC